MRNLENHISHRLKHLRNPLQRGLRRPSPRRGVPASGKESASAAGLSTGCRFSTANSQTLWLMPPIWFTDRFGMGVRRQPCERGGDRPERVVFASFQSHLCRPDRARNCRILETDKAWKGTVSAPESVLLMPVLTSSRHVDFGTWGPLLRCGDEYWGRSPGGSHFRSFGAAS